MLFIEPFRADQTEEQRHRARGTALLLLLIAVVVALLWLVDNADVAPPILRISYVLVILACYFGVRMGFLRSGASAAALALLVMPALILLNEFDFDTQLAAWRVLALRTTAAALALLLLVHPMRWVLLTWAGVVAGTWLLIAADIVPEGMLNAVAEPFVSAVAFVFILVIVRTFAQLNTLQAERAIATTEAGYGALANDQSELICRWLPDETIIFVNDAYCRVLQHSREELLGRSVLMLVDPEDLLHVRAQIAGLSKETPSATYEHRVTLRDGSRIWLKWVDRAIFDRDGKIIELHSIGHDTTQLKLAEAAEREQRVFAETLRASSALIASSLELDEVLDHLLAQIGNAYPYVHATVMLVQGDIASVARSNGKLDEDYALLVRTLRLRISATQNLRHMMETRQPLLISDTRQHPGWLFLRGSEWIRASVAAPIILENETIGFLILNSNQTHAFTENHASWLQAFAGQAALAIRNAHLYNTARRYAKELEMQVRNRTQELELERGRLSAIFDSTGEGIVYTEDEVIRFVNPTFCKMMYCAPDQVHGVRLSTLFSPNASETENEKLSRYIDIINEIGIFRGEMPIRRLNGSDFVAGLTISSIGSLSETPARAVMIVRDISQEKALQVQRSNLLSYASHELRTPLTNLKTRLYVIRRRPEMLMEQLPVLEHVAGQMHQLIEMMLDATRLERGVVQIECVPMDVGPLISESVQIQQLEAEKKRITLTVEVPSQPLIVNVDALRLNQVLTNLITNALNYTPEGGTVTVVAKRTGDVALLSVADTGIGIAPEHLPYIFEPFYRVPNKVGGTGLGLSIVRQIVQLHKGEISMQSELGIGSRFMVRLPIYVKMPLSQHSPH